MIEKKKDMKLFLYIEGENSGIYNQIKRENIAIIAEEIIGHDYKVIERLEGFACFYLHYKSFLNKDNTKELQSVYHEYYDYMSYIKLITYLDKEITCLKKILPFKNLDISIYFNSLIKRNRCKYDELLNYERAIDYIIKKNVNQLKNKNKHLKDTPIEVIDENQYNRIYKLLSKDLQNSLDEINILLACGEFDEVQKKQVNKLRALTEKTEDLTNNTEETILIEDFWEDFLGFVKFLITEKGADYKESKHREWVKKNVLKDNTITTNESKQFNVLEWAAIYYYLGYYERKDPGQKGAFKYDIQKFIEENKVIGNKGLTTKKAFENNVRHADTRINNPENTKDKTKKPFPPKTIENLIKKAPLIKKEHRRIMLEDKKRLEETIKDFQDDKY